MKMFAVGGKFSDLNEEKNAILLYVIHETDIVSISTLFSCDKK